ncbi:MAG: amino acid-binding domain protein [Bacillales bacterium]|jgi:chorismate mutase|nr:amino acid-binding domain protein [Bacillales bacterium]
MNNDKEFDSNRFWLVREDVLPEALLKTIQAKELLQKDDLSINEAVKQVNLSRSAFYRYKDAIMDFEKVERKRFATISMDLKDNAGVLSNVLHLISSFEGNVITISQTIPISGQANVVLSIDISQLNSSIKELIEAIRSEKGVIQSSLIVQG